MDSSFLIHTLSLISTDVLFSKVKRQNKKKNGLITRRLYYGCRHEIEVLSAENYDVGAPGCQTLWADGQLVVLLPS